MSYPGNTTLGQDTQQRLLATFEQTLDLVERGNTQEALLGCDFILRMDPQFEPARKLLDRINAGDAQPAIVDLRSAGGRAAPAPPPKPAAAVQPPGEELSFADLSDFGAADLSARQPALPAAAVRAEITNAFAARRFADVVATAGQQGGVLDPDLADMAEQAQARLEAEPYVRKFLTAARDAARAGQNAEAQRALNKAGALDEGHPEIAEILAIMAGSAEPSTPPAPAFEEPSGTGPDWGELPSLTDPALSMEGLSLEPIRLGSEPAAPAATGSESDRRIAELLAEGDAAFARNEHQAAIDAWSRIFLIDIDHEAASRKIEEARSLKAEAERKVEEIFHEAVMHVDAGRTDEAKAALTRVLQIQPNYLAARELLDQLNTPGGAPRDARARATTGATAAAAATPVLKEEILVPPEPGTVLASGPRPVVGAASPRRRFLIIGGAVLALVAAGGYLVWSQRERLFPNSTPAAVAPAPDPLARAISLHEQGKTAAAIAQLRRMPPEDPQHQRAQELVAEWEALAAPATTGPAPELVAKRDTLLASGRTAAGAGERLKARSLYDQAAAVLELPAEAAAERTALEAALAPIAPQIDLFRQGDYEFALPDLWRRHEAEPTNRDVTRMLVDGYYNLGVRALQREAPREAAGHFKETVTLAPGDAELARLLRFSETYTGRPLDLLYRTFVKYLPLREL